MDDAAIPIASADGLIRAAGVAGRGEAEAEEYGRRRSDGALPLAG